MTTRRKPLEVLKLSLAAMAAIAVWEGTTNVAYKDVGGLPTIGIGSTYYPSGTEITRNGITYITGVTTEVKLGDKISTTEAQRIAKEEAENTFGTGIAKCIKVPLNQAEYDTYISFSYNIGVNAFCKSTLVSLLNSYEYAKACAQLLRWTYVNGKKVRGLVNRRNDEFKRCIGEYNSEYYSEEVESA